MLEKIFPKYSTKKRKNLICYLGIYKAHWIYSIHMFKNFYDTCSEDSVWTETLILLAKWGHFWEVRMS